ncbi:MAG: putative S-layer protein [Nanoarchaeota archaeon]
MKSKILSLFLLTAIFSLLMVSAAVNFTVSTLEDFSQSKNSVTFIVTNLDAATPLNVSFANTLSILDKDNNAVQFTIAGNQTTILSTIPRTFTITPILPIDYAKFNFGEAYFKDLVITNSAIPAENQTIKVSLKPSFCSLDNKAKLAISNLEINTLEGYGDDESFWYPLDKVELSFDVENKGAWDVRDIEIQICVFDTKSKSCKFDEDDFDLSDDKFDIDYDDNEVTVTATLDVDPDKLIAGNTDYTIYIKAEGQTDDSDAGTEDEKFNCISSLDDIKIRTDEAFVIFSGITFSEDTLQCESEATLDFEVWNVGDEDLADDEIFVNVYNKELGINKDVIFSNGIDKMDKVDASISFTIPKNIKETSYKLLLKAYDDDRYSDDDAYQNKEDDLSKTDAFFTVKGNCGATITSNVLITAELDSTTPEAVPGKQVIVKATVKNLGTSTLTSILSVSGNSAWSSLKSIDPQTLVLNAGESKTVNILLNIDADAEGEKEFTITSTSGDKITEQKVALSLTKSNATSSIIANHLKANWFIYVIVLVNIILIITIIAVVKSMVGRGNSL